MAKIKISVRIKSNIKNYNVKTNAILQDDILKYQENKDIMVKFIYHTNNLIRETKDIKLNYIFDEKQETLGKIYIKNLKKELNVLIKTIKIKRNKNDLNIIYEIENEKFNLQLKEIK